jgi:hypothetical protein
MRLIERFTPIGPGTLRWEFTLEDPTTFTGPGPHAWRLDTSDSVGRACHEGKRGHGAHPQRLTHGPRKLRRKVRNGTSRNAVNTEG